MTTQERIDAVREAFPEVKRLCDTYVAATEEFVKAMLGDRYRECDHNMFTLKEELAFEATNHPAVAAKAKAEKEISEYMHSLSHSVATAMLTTMYIGCIMPEAILSENDTPERFFERFEQTLDKHVLQFAKSTLATKPPCLVRYLRGGLKVLTAQ